MRKHTANDPMRRLREVLGGFFEPAAPVVARLASFARHEPVLSIAAVLAAASFVLNPPLRLPPR